MPPKDLRMLLSRAKRALLLAVFGLACLLWNAPAGAYAQPDLPACAGLDADQGGCRYLLKLGASATSASPDEVFARHQLIPLKYYAQIGVWSVAMPVGPGEIRRASLAADPAVLWLEQDGLVYAASPVVPNDPYFPALQWNLELIEAPFAWRFSTGNLTWPIAVIDTGVDLDHPDLQNKIWTNAGEIPANLIDDDGNGYVDDVQGWDFVNADNLPQDDHFHGSFVAGIAAAESNNGVGIAALAWGAPVMPLKALNSLGSGSASAVAEAILYAADNGAKIINLSLGAPTEFLVITQAVEYARAQGCLLVAAAGNKTTQVEFPAASPGVLAVAATDGNDAPADFSNFGPEIDVAAPGVAIFSLNNNGSYVITNGTSASAPQVSGLAALIWAMEPEWNALQVSHAITSTTIDVDAAGFDVHTGWGRINANLAVDPTRLYFYLPIHFGGIN